MQRATKSLFGSMSSGEGLVATFSGSGKVLIAPIPYWRHRMMAFMSAVKSMKDQNG